MIPSDPTPRLAVRRRPDLHAAGRVLHRVAPDPGRHRVEAAAAADQRDFGGGDISEAQMEKQYHKFIPEPEPRLRRQARRVLPRSGRTRHIPRRRHHQATDHRSGAGGRRLLRREGTVLEATRGLSRSTPTPEASPVAPAPRPARPSPAVVNEAGLTDSVEPSWIVSDASALLAPGGAVQALDPHTVRCAPPAVQFGALRGVPASTWEIWMIGCGQMVLVVSHWCLSMAAQGVTD